jgi:hypothetical protein
MTSKKTKAAVGRRGESAAEKRAHELALIAEAVAKEKASTESKPKPTPEEVIREMRAKWNRKHPNAPLAEQPKSAREQVLQALGHDANGTCPKGVDYRTDPNKVPDGLQDAHALARMRARCHFILLHCFEKRTEQPSLPGCGWWWCEQKDRLKAAQWSDLLAALEILKENDVDPHDAGVVQHACLYSTGKRYKEAWSQFKPRAKFIDADPAAAAYLPEEMRREVERYRRVAGPRAGKSIDMPLQHFLNRIYDAGGTWQIAAALFFLFGLAKRGASFKDVKHDIEVRWTRPNKLNGRQSATTPAELASQSALGKL